MPKAKPKKDEKPQSERFKETARKLEVDETGEAFDRALKKITRIDRAPSPNLD